MATRLANSARVVDSASGCPEIPIIIGPGNARVVMWPGNNAQFRTFQIITLERGARTIRLHHGSDAVYYVMSGAGSIVDLASSEVFPLVEDPNSYFYLPNKVRLGVDENGTPQFSFMRFMEQTYPTGDPMSYFKNAATDFGFGQQSNKVEI